MRRLGIALMLLTTLACGATTSPSGGTSVPPAPSISFDATSSRITAGDTTTLRWTVANATQLRIDGGVGDVTGKTSVAVTPAASTVYTLTATGPGGTRTAAFKVTVDSRGTPDPAAPVIASFTATPTTISPGATSALAWSVSGAAALSIDHGVGDVTSRTGVTVTPAATTTYTLTATGAGGLTTTARVTVTVSTPPGAADATLTIDTTQRRRAISPYVYGYNASTVAEAAPGTTYLRAGGNRWTAYNWASNYSNAGADWKYYNDTFMGSPTDGPGHAATPTLDDAKTNGVAALVTIPMQGWVAKDATGTVPFTSALADHFVPNKPRKGSAFTTTPSASSAEVYQDEFAAFVAQRLGAGREVHLSLDNEPDLWGYLDASGKAIATHAEVQRTQLGYADFLARWLESAQAIRAAVPAALLYGPVSYGWTGYISFQNAPDKPADASIDNSFLDYFLAKVSAASSTAGVRLLDALDLHFYSSAQSRGCANAADDAVTVQAGDFDTTAPAWVKRNLDCVVAARVQAPRSLFDPAFVESSWITQWTTASSALGQGIQLVPRMLAKISAKYPGTKLSLSEYNHGGADHVSGAVAQADTLGILGREGVYAAAYWPITTDTTWIKAAFRNFRNYDGAGKSFGDTSVQATSTDLEHVSVYASVDASSAGRLVLVIVHRPTLSSGVLDLRSRAVKIQWTHPQALATARAWQLTSTSSSPAPLAAPAVNGSSVTLTLPGMSVTTLELTP